jgi:hypothetical protein
LAQISVTEDFDEDDFNLRIKKVLFNTFGSELEVAETHFLFSNMVGFFANI